LDEVNPREELKHYFEEVLFSREVVVTKINLAYDMRNFTRLNEERHDLIQ
jgi:hypothetical protein